LQLPSWPRGRWSRIDRELGGQLAAERHYVMRRLEMLHKVALCTVAACACATTEPVSPATPLAPATGVPAFKRVRPAAGPSTIRLEVDRDYEVREMEFKRPAGTPPKDLRMLVFNPKDEQSSALFGIGADGHRKTEETIAKHYEGARVTKVAGTISGKSVEWWHYRDRHHLYSTCYTSFVDNRGADRPVYFDLVANTPERLSSLERAFSRIMLVLPGGKEVLIDFPEPRP
jgi:hypothetical protein